MGVLGLGAASAPLVAKQALDGEITGLTTLRGEPRYRPFSNLPPPVSQSLNPSVTQCTSVSQCLSGMRHLGIPEFVRERLREESSYVTALDPDIACKRSWSMSVKIVTQRERNYQRAIARMQGAGLFDEANAAFEKVSGFRWLMWW